MNLLTQATTNWQRWCVRHLDGHNDYGVLNVEDALLLLRLRFGILGNKFSSLSTYLEKTLGPLLAKVKKTIEGANVGGLKAGVKTYANMVLALSTEIKEKEVLIMHAGLNGHEEEIQKSLDLLS